MKMKLVIFSVVAFLTACGGGGGGGDGTQANARPNTGFRVMHAGIDFSPVDISVSGAEQPVLGRVRFSQSSNYFSQEPQTKTINLLRANVPSELVASTQLTLGEGEVRTLLLYGDPVVFGKKVAIIEDPRVELGDAQSAIRVIHGALAAAEIVASAGGELITTGVPFGSASPYLTTPSGPTLVRARRSADGAVIFSQTLLLEPGKTYSLLISGEVDYLARGELVEF